MHNTKNTPNTNYKGKQIQYIYIYSKITKYQNITNNTNIHKILQNENTCKLLEIIAIYYT